MGYCLNLFDFGEVGWRFNCSMLGRRGGGGDAIAGHGPLRHTVDRPGGRWPSRIVGLSWFSMLGSASE